LLDAPWRVDERLDVGDEVTPAHGRGPVVEQRQVSIARSLEFQISQLDSEPLKRERKRGAKRRD
jgi:hypothetical protein